MYSDYQPSLKFGIAFIEASGPRLIRFDGNDEELIKIAVENAQRLGGRDIALSLY